MFRINTSSLFLSCGRSCLWGGGNIVAEKEEKMIDRWIDRQSGSQKNRLHVKAPLEIERIAKYSPWHFCINLCYIEPWSTQCRKQWLPCPAFLAIVICPITCHPERTKETEICIKLGKNDYHWNWNWNGSLTSGEDNFESLRICSTLNFQEEPPECAVAPQ